MFGICNGNKCELILHLALYWGGVKSLVVTVFNLTSLPENSWNRDIASYIHSVGTSKVSGKLHVPTALSVVKLPITRNCTQYSLAWVFLPFCTCCILICLMCFVASFKLSCV